MAQIDPKNLKGFRDFLPEKQIPRQKMIETIKASYETFGFEPLETPVLEYAETLVGKYGDEGDKLMYRFKDNGDRDVAMRYDLTIPLARVVAMNGELKKPFKRYQISPVWRADNTQKGRFREFYQCDADIVGSTSTLADAEILALSATTLKKLGVNDFIIRVNSREIISDFYKSIGLSPAQQTSAIRAVDKVDKVGKEGVREELMNAGIDANAIERIVSFADTSVDFVNNSRDVATLIEAFPMLQKALSELIVILDSASKLSPDTRFIIDFSIARGLDYYTGIIFETNLTSISGFGAICAGGRYDNLVGIFSNKKVPAVGMSIGLDRLYSALEELKLITEVKTTARVLVVNFEESLVNEYLALVSKLREANINTMLYFETADLKKQLSYASDKGIKYALIYGANEAKENIVVIKNLEQGTQEKVEFAKVVASLQ